MMTAVIAVTTAMTATIFRAAFSAVTPMLAAFEAIDTCVDAAAAASCDTANAVAEPAAPFVWAA